MTEKQYNYLKIPMNDAGNQQGISEELRVVSRIGAEKLEPGIVPFQLERVLDNLRSVVVPKAEKKGLAITFDIAAEVPGCLVGDPLRLGQVLRKLVDNAIKFTDTGEIAVSAVLQDCSKHDLVLAFSVKDTGIGMDTAQRESLCTLFSEAGGSGFRNYGGTGCGLAICRSLVELMGGKVWVESEAGSGSVFTFTVRFSCEANISRQQFLPSEELKGTRVLVVDDSPTCRAVFTAALELWGVYAETADSGKDALQMLHRACSGAEPFDLVILDWKMPELSGLDTIRAMLEDSELQPAPRVLLATAYGLENVKREAKGLAIDGFLDKPVQQHVLYTAIKDVLHPEKFPGKSEKKIRLSADHRCDDNAPLQRTVLIVDDEPLVREVLRRRLSRHNYRVDIAADGFEAGVKALQLKPDLVILDLFMQGIDGFDVCRTIRKNKELRSAKVLVFTGYDSPDLKARAQQMGADGYLTKTMDFDVVRRQIEQLFQESGEENIDT